MSITLALPWAVNVVLVSESERKCVLILLDHCKNETAIGDGQITESHLFWKKNMKGECLISDHA